MLSALKLRQYVTPKIPYSSARLHGIVSHKATIFTLRIPYSESEQIYQYYVYSTKTLHNIRKENNYRLIHRALKSKIPVGKCVSTQQPIVARAAYYVYVINKYRQSSLLRIGLRDKIRDDRAVYCLYSYVIKQVSKEQSTMYT